MHAKIQFWCFPELAGAEGEEREERAVSGTCLTVDVTLLPLVFAFELPNKSDTYLLLLLYDSMRAAEPGPSRVSPLRAHTGPGEQREQ